MPMLLLTITDFVYNRPIVYRTKSLREGHK